MCIFPLSNRPLGGSILIVEMDSDCLSGEAARVFREGDYRMPISTGAHLSRFLFRG